MAAGWRSHDHEVGSRRNQPVRAFVGHPSLTIVARQLQAMAAANGMTEEVHDELIRSLQNDG